MELEILSASSDNKSLGTCPVTQQTTIKEIRQIIHELLDGPAPQRQLLRLEAKDGRPLADDETIAMLELKNGDKIYLKDLGQQIGWRKVFIAQYLGTLLVYQRFYASRDYQLYQEALVVDLAAACLTLHCLKRLYETMYVHRFSRETMPLKRLFRNCAYYWCFTALMGWEINALCYLPRSHARVWFCLLLFLMCEYGNYSVHLLLRELRSPGSQERRIPMPNNNPFTKLFDRVSFPHYTYETCAWFAFAVMTSSLGALLFAIIGAIQMSKWAVKKHQRYLNEFENYPKQRRAIYPYIL